MKSGIHPEYREVVFQDMQNDFKFITRSTLQTRDSIEFEGKTYPLFKLDTSSESHPFYTGAQTRIVETGRVESSARSSRPRAKRSTRPPPRPTLPRLGAGKEPAGRMKTGAATAALFVSRPPIYGPPLARMSFEHRPSPSRVTEAAAATFPRWLLFALLAVYIVPGLFGRHPGVRRTPALSA